MGALTTPPSIQQELDLASRRHAVAEWRDRQILAFDDFFNQHAALAREAFDQELVTAPREATFNVVPYASGRIDVLMAASLTERVQQQIATACEDLAAIDVALAELGDTLIEAIQIPAPTVSASEVSDENVGLAPDLPASGTASGLIPVSVVRRVAALADDAANATDGFIRQPLQTRRRLREAAAQRLAEYWMSLKREHESVLAQIIQHLDAVANEARTRLS